MQELDTYFNMTGEDGENQGADFEKFIDDVVSIA
jgi:hypothetical protein